MKRVRAPELIDGAEAVPERIAESFGDLVWYNRYLGGTAGVLHQLRTLLDDGSRRRLNVLDVGAGAGDILLSIERWLRSRGVGLRGVALDAGGAALAKAGELIHAHGSEGRIRRVRGDGLALPFADASFDVAYCSTFLHHFDPAAAVTVLREMARVSVIGIVVTDLRRGVIGYTAARFLAETFWRSHPYSRHDGPASMRAAYTLEEADELARRAGLATRAEPQPFFRWALRWRRPRSD